MDIKKKQLPQINDASYTFRNKQRLSESDKKSHALSNILMENGNGNKLPSSRGFQNNNQNKLKSSIKSSHIHKMNDFLDD